jgi:carboxyl-terminal processing protease
MINEGDIIIKITTSGIDKLFDCIDFEEATNYLSATDLIQADFVIKKESGKQISVHLQKDKTKVEDNVIKSYILQGEKRIGYIYLPSFYTQMDGSEISTKGCANNLATELVKLKKEKIDGLILDLRNNGGGSMMEAVLMTGIFINYGAVSIVSSRDEVPQTLKDMNRGTIYANPLVILVNEFSASASELFAAAMQDQNRALIVGSKTFGKSTYQAVLPIDAFKYDHLENYSGNASGFVKVTMGAFYRVTGISHQKTGIIPDIKLPSLYSNCNFGEQSYQSAIDSLSINKKAYYYPGPSLPKLDLQRLSLQRTEHNKGFNEIEKQSLILAQNQHQYAVSLNFNAFKKNYFAEEADINTPVETTVFKAENPAYYKTISHISNADQKMNEHTIKQINNDIYIIEGYYIICDLINLKKNNAK